MRNVKTLDDIKNESAAWKTLLLQGVVDKNDPASPICHSKIDPDELKRLSGWVSLYAHRVINIPGHVQKKTKFFIEKITGREFLHVRVTGRPVNKQALRVGRVVSITPDITCEKSNGSVRARLERYASGKRGTIYISELDADLQSDLREIANSRVPPKASRDEIRNAMMQIVTEITGLRCQRDKPESQVYYNRK